jgi:hypothetical protein
VPTAMITGSPERVPDVTIALKSEGFDIISSGTAAAVAEAAAGIAPGSIDCYVQLPGGPPTNGHGALSHARTVVAEAVLARFDAAAQLAPLLAPSASVVLVASDVGQVEEGPVARRRHALRSLLGVLAEAIRLDYSARRVRVVDEERSPAEIAAIARGFEPAASYPELGSELNFADWKSQMLSLGGPQD